MRMTKIKTIYGHPYELEMETSVTVEPLPGHSDEEVVASLKSCGASGVKILAPGFISATADHTSLKRLKKIAAVHLNQESQAY